MRLRASALWLLFISHDQQCSHFPAPRSIMDMHTMIPPMEANPMTPEETNLEGPNEWASVPKLDHGDGWYATERGYALDGKCRIDGRFIGQGSWAVRRLGGDALAERLIDAVRRKHPAPGKFEQGALIVDGILFEYTYSPRFAGTDEEVSIGNAELVAPHPGQPEALRRFFISVWEGRVRHANSVLRSLNEFSDAL